MVKYAKLINAKDNVVTVVADLKEREQVFVKFQGKQTIYRCNQNIPFGHKIAITDINQDDPVIKYGQVIGIASQNIQKGDWVHTHNVRDDYKVLDKNANPLPGQEKK